jgi:putative hemolysin
MESDIPLWAVGLRLVLFFASFLIVGFFAASETAFLSMDKWAVEGLKDEDRRAKVLSDLEKDFRNTTSALLIGTNVFTVLSSVMAASLADILAFNETLRNAVLPLAITALMFFFSQLVPKTYASRSPTEMALAVAPVLSVISRVLRPVSSILSLGPHLLAQSVGESARSVESISDEPVRLAVDLAAEEGQVDKDAGEVIVGVLDSSDIRVSDIMVPLPSAFVFEENTRVKDALNQLRAHRFSRVPVVDGGGEVVGLVYMKDVLRQVMKEPDCRKNVRDIMRKPLRVSPSDSVLDVLGPMRKDRIHLAVVFDGEHTVGIVTLDDVLEEIVGDMPDAAVGRVLSKKAPYEEPHDMKRVVSGLQESDAFDAVGLNELDR